VRGRLRILSADLAPPCFRMGWPAASGRDIAKASRREELPRARGFTPAFERQPR
jgi:hypothetical protein